jgi:arylsulfatase A-like enzyme
VTKDEAFENGFHSPEEYNSFRFMDHSIGVFMEQVRKEPYFDNTIFVFYGDHGIHANIGVHTPKYEEQLGLQGLRVPFVLYAPRLLPAGQVHHKLASEVDVMPTLAGLALDRYVNTTMGRDLLDDRFNEMRYAFTVTHGQGLRIGILDEEFYFLMNDDGTQKVLHQLEAEDPRADTSAAHPERAAKLEELTRAIFETTRYMRFHNARKE